MNEMRKTLHLMGTKITLYLKAPDAERLVKKACQMLIQYEAMFSANRDTSQLGLLNKSAHLAPQSVDPELYELIKIGLAHSLDEDSFLNIAIGPLVKLWKVGFEGASVPSERAIKQALSLISPELIALNDHGCTAEFLKAGVEIDLGAIAKGYICDKIMAFFKANGAQSAMIDIGGNVLVCGDSPSGDNAWKVGIQNPNMPRGHVVGLVKIKNQSMVTSGIYERWFERQGRKYHHIFDCKTGYPIESQIASLSIISDRSLDGDLYTTKLFGLDAVHIIRKVNQMAGLGAVVITTDGQIAHTDNLKGRVTWLFEGV